MSIETAIHQRWETYRPLTDIVGTAKVRTGWMPPMDADFNELALPFVTVIRDGDATTLTPSGITITQVRVRMSVWDDELSVCKQVAERIHRRFDGAQFDYLEGRVVTMQPMGDSEGRADDGTWLAGLSFFTVTEETR